MREEPKGGQTFGNGFSTGDQKSKGRQLRRPERREQLGGESAR